MSFTQMMFRGVNFGEAMNPTCKSRLKDLEIVRQFWNQQRNLSPEKQVERKLGHLQAFIQQLEQTPSGMDELRRRFRRFGDCKQVASETTMQFHGRLRCWLDRDIEG